MSILVIALSTLVIIYCCHLLFKRYQFAHKLNKIPGFPSSFLGLGIRSSYAFYQVFASAPTNKVPDRVAQFMSSLYSLFPDGMYKIWFGPIPLVFISKPDMIQSFMNNHKNETRKASFYKFMEPYMGNGLITSHGEDWKHQRKLLTPAFHFKILEHAIPVMNKNADVLVSNMEQGMREGKAGVIDDISKYILLCSLDIISESAMGREMHAQSESESEFVTSNRQITHGFICRTVNPLYAIDALFRRSNVGKKFYQNRDSVRVMIEGLIQSKKKELEVKQDQENKEHRMRDSEEDKPPAFLDILMKFHQESPDGLTLVDLRDQIMTFMSAGYETTGWTLTWVMYLLSFDQEVQRRLHEELDQEFADKDDLTSDQLKHGLPLTEAVIKETMRIYPAIASFARQLEQDIEINGIHIPAPANISVNVHALHHDPDLWEEPDRFNPDRFLTDRGGNRHHPFAYLPFSAGARNCIGQRFAIMELKLLVAKICRKFVISHVNSGYDMETRFAIVLSAAREIPLRLQLRSQE